MHGVMNMRLVVSRFGTVMMFSRCRQMMMRDTCDHIVTHNLLHG